ncbi:hypothetical protein FRC0414_01396 [Corynebacterium diphtheriae]|nr:hypothetical protein FRC0414_01396 [Corynebacterium diphtheriae]
MKKLRVRFSQVIASCPERIDQHEDHVDYIYALALHMGTHCAGHIIKTSFPELT